MYARDELNYKSLNPLTFNLRLTFQYNINITFFKLNKWYAILLI